jgi:hypothetical protein
VRYVKGVLAGLLVVVLTTVLVVIGLFVFMRSRSAITSIGLGAEAYSVNTDWVSVPLGLIVLAAFAAGFLWEFRRASRRQR